MIISLFEKCKYILNNNFKAHVKILIMNVIVMHFLYYI